MHSLRSNGLEINRTIQTKLTKFDRQLALVKVHNYTETSSISTEYKGENQGSSQKFFEEGFEFFCMDRKV